MENEQKLKKETYFVLHTNDYRSGPELYYIKQDEQNKEEEEDGFVIDEDNGSTECDNENIEKEYLDGEYVEFEFSKEKFTVYRLMLYIGDYQLKKLHDGFTNIDDAYLFCRQQYYLYSGDFPFISNGKSDSACHPLGERERVDIPDDAKCLLDEGESYECSDYLIVISNNFFRDYSLNPYSVWYKPKP